MNDGPRQREARVDGAARVYGQGWGRSVRVGQCRIVAAELRGTNSGLKTGGGLRRNRGGFSAAESDLLSWRALDVINCRKLRRGCPRAEKEKLDCVCE
jgi:hypothetical protein